MVPIFINKDVFEPSYNDLKFRAETHNYICTNLTHSSILAWRILMNRGAWWATVHGVEKSQT